MSFASVVMVGLTSFVLVAPTLMVAVLLSGMARPRGSALPVRPKPSPRPSAEPVRLDSARAARAA